MHIFIFLFLFFLFSVDHSRIRLQLGTNDYINASLITVEEARRNYILTQVSVEKIQHWKFIISSNSERQWQKNPNF